MLALKAAGRTSYLQIFMCVDQSPLLTQLLVVWRRKPPKNLHGSIFLLASRLTCVRGDLLPDGGRVWA